MTKERTKERDAIRKLLDTRPQPVDQVLHLRKQIQEQGATINRLRAKLGDQQEFAGACCASVAAADPLPPFKSAKRSKTTAPIVAVIKFSDWHIGEVIQGDETEGFNAFNYAIARQRIQSIISDFAAWVKVQRTVYQIDRCVVFGEGDYVSGDIHPELLATNEFPLPEQAAKAGLLLGETLRELCGHFSEVEAALLSSDNHGRLQKKPQSKQKGANNMSHVVNALALALTQQCSNLRVTGAKGAKMVHPVNGKKFLIEHGDGIKGNMGIPYYGFNRLVGKEATRRMGTRKEFDYLSIGHFHVPAIIEMRTLVNGSLSGTTEFDHGQGRHAKPAQVAFLVHPVHGIFNWVPFQG